VSDCVSGGGGGSISDEFPLVDDLKLGARRNHHRRKHKRNSS
jgi:hypothetical protein